MIYTALYASPVGKLTLAAEKDALVGLWIEGQKFFESTLTEPPVPGEDLPLLCETAAWLDRYFAGERPAPAELPLHPQGTPFRERVWALLREIPYGTVTTYGALAEQLSAGARAIGNAVGHNPISIIIPCHRVVGAGGTLTGYAGGLSAKEALLRHEGVPVCGNQVL